MHTFISFLRGINVSGKNLIKMADLKKVMEQNGFFEITTYLQSGNLITRSKLENATDVSKKIEEIIRNEMNLEVPVLSMNPEKLQEILKKTPFQQELKETPDRLYFTLLFDIPDIELGAELEKSDYPPEKFVLNKQVIYLYVPKGYGKSKLNNNFFENKLKVRATTRNLKTILNLQELSRSLFS